PVVPTEPCSVGVAAAGPSITGTMDAHSDVDLVAVIDPRVYWEVMNDRPQILARLGSLLPAITGEHIGDPRLMICSCRPRRRRRRSRSSKRRAAMSPEGLSWRALRSRKELPLL